MTVSSMATAASSTAPDPTNGSSTNCISGTHGITLSAHEGGARSGGLKWAPARSAPPLAPAARGCTWPVRAAAGSESRRAAADSRPTVETKVMMPALSVLSVGADRQTMAKSAPPGSAAHRARPLPRLSASRSSTAAAPRRLALPAATQSAPLPAHSRPQQQPQTNSTAPPLLVRTAFSTALDHGAYKERRVAPGTIGAKPQPPQPGRLGAACGELVLGLARGALPGSCRPDMGDHTVRCFGL